MLSISTIKRSQDWHNQVVEQDNTSIRMAHPAYRTRQTETLNCQPTNCLSHDAWLPLIGRDLDMGKLRKRTHSRHTHYTTDTTHHSPHTTHHTPRTTHCTLHTTHYTLDTTHYTPHTTHHTLHITHYTLHKLRKRTHSRHTQTFMSVRDIQN